MHRFLYLKYMILLLVGICSTSEGRVGNDVIIKAESDQEFVVGFSPQEGTIRPEFVHGNSYYKTQFEHGVFETEFGET